MAKFLDQAGLAILWAQIKGLIPEGTIVTETELVEILSKYVTTNTLNETVEALEQKIAEEASKVFTFKGSVTTYDDLPTENREIGDVYNIEQADPDEGILAGDNVVWTGDSWDKLAGSVDLSAYATKEYVEENFVPFTVEGTNGTALIQNEPTGGGPKFHHNDGTESFVGVNDGGANGMVAQIYADKQVDGNWIGSRLNVYQKGMFYHNAEDKADTEHYIADDPAHEIATLGDIPEDKIYYTTKICQLTTGASASKIEAAIGSWDALYQAIMDNKIIVDTEITGQGDATWSNPRPAVTASAQGNVVIHLTFYITTQRMVHCEIQNVSGSPLAIAVDDYYIGDASVTNNNKTVIDSLPDQFLTDIVNVTRTDTTNTAEIRIFTKQPDGTYSPDTQHGVLTLVGAGTIPGAGTGAGLMTVADKEKLDGIDALTEEEILAILNN